MGFWPSFRSEPEWLGPPKHELTGRQKREELEGATVFCVQCDGCMAHDHKFQWIGIVQTVFEKGNNVNANVKIVKQDHIDWRDVDLGIKTINIGDPSLQQLGPKLFCWYR